MNDRSLATYKRLSLGLALIFALVGAAFLILPQATLAFFNAVSRRLGMAEGPADRWFFSVLTVAYMYVVTVLAWLMYRSPREKIFPFLLAQAKLASAALSFLMFAVQGPWLIYLANGVVDAAIGLLVLAMYFRVRSEGRGAAS
jgi:hypothetical protein